MSVVGQPVVSAPRDTGRKKLNIKRKRELEDAVLHVPDTDARCSCEKSNPNLAYCSGGCLRCPTQDCAFYIQNFNESILSFYCKVLDFQQ